MRILVVPSLLLAKVLFDLVRRLLPARDRSYSSGGRVLIRSFAQECDNVGDKLHMVLLGRFSIFVEAFNIDSEINIALAQRLHSKLQALDLGLMRIAFLLS